jgi:spermidine synthase
MLRLTGARLQSREAGIEVGAILISILIIATCGLVYELIIGTLSSYLLGDSVFQFSLTIGIFLTSMGIGSFLSRAVRQDLLLVFLVAEIAIGLVGGVSAAWLFGVYAIARRSFTIVMIATIVALGALIGLEIPLLTRIARRYGNLRDTLANVLAFDYLGALAASLLFPLILLPYLGLIKTAFLVGLFNLLVVGISLRVFGRGLPQARAVTISAGAVAVLLLVGFVQAAAATSFFEHRTYQDQIIYSEQSRYQRIIVTRYQDDVRLYLDNEVQFSTRDEYRYHESLVHPAMSLAPSRERVLVIGGGDGLVLREVLKYPDVQYATLVDIDPAMTNLGQTFGPIVEFNRGSLNDPRVHIVNEDGFKFLESSSDLYPVIISDLPDPRTEGLAKMYSLEFYTLVKRHLARGGMFVAQSSSPYFVRTAYWCAVHTAEAAGLNVRTYHTYIPAFGDWGFLLASDLNLDWSALKLRVPQAGDQGTRYLTADVLAKMAVFDPDTAEVPTDVSSLQNPVILRYYMEGVKRWRG